MISSVRWFVHSMLNFTINFSEVKDVEVQGQNRRTENLPLAWSWFEIIFAKFSNSTDVILSQNMTFNRTSNGGLEVVCTLSVLSGY